MLFLGFSVCVILEMSAMLGVQARVSTASSIRLDEQDMRTLSEHACETA